jgi:maspardin
MRSKLKWFVSLFIVIGLVILYFWPTPIVLFDQLYAKVEPSIVDSLQSFRRTNPPRQLQNDGVDWEYIAVGEGKETIVFLHGMTGAYDIWWQQIDVLKVQYRIISVTYPPVQSLASLEKGVLAILEKEGVKEFSAVGTSLGGYFVQYLIVKHPKRIRRVVLSNTFPPNDLIAEKNRTLGMFLPLLPEWIVMSVFRGNFQQTIYPTSGNNELTLAFLNEIGYGRMSKAHLTGRYYCHVNHQVSDKVEIVLSVHSRS